MSKRVLDNREIEKKVFEEIDRICGDNKIDYYRDISKNIGCSIYEVLCEIERVTDYNGLADIFSRSSGIERAEALKGKILEIRGNAIETDNAIYIWHYAYLNTLPKGKKVFIISRDVFSKLSFREISVYENLSSIKDWFIHKALNPAIKLNATDIHIVPGSGANMYKFFYRIMGDLKDVLTVGVKHGRSVSNMLMHWAKEFTPSLKFDENKRPQDGRIEVTRDVAGVPIDIRMSFIPRPNMEDIDIVCRLLYKIELKSESLQSLGFLDPHAKMLEGVAKRNKGIALVTGATGSGKSRTINTILSMISSSRNILTVEDPVEYILPNARQFQTFEWEEGSGRIHRIGFQDFGRAFKRHDPDVIFIGELRDKETVDAAFHLSKTGHLVFATLHASRATMVPELLLHDYNMSVDIISDNLTVVVNQALVKKLCRRCAVEKTAEISDYVVSMLKYPNARAAMNRLTGQKVYEPGRDTSCECSVFHNNLAISTGYTGRTVVAECISFSPEMFSDDKLSVPAMDDKTVAGYGNILTDTVEKIQRGLIDLSALERLL